MIPAIVQKASPDKTGGWLPEEIEKVIRFVVSIEFRNAKLSTKQFEEKIENAWKGTTVWLEENTWKAHGVHLVGPEAFSKITVIILNKLKIYIVPQDIEKIFKRLKIQVSTRVKGWVYNGQPAAYKKEDTMTDIEGMRMVENDELGEPQVPPSAVPEPTKPTSDSSGKRTKGTLSKK